MTLDDTVRGQVHITMIDSLDKVIITFEKAEPNGGGTKTSASPDILFKVDKDFKKLPQSKTMQFHNLAANTLYATKRARPDTCMAIEFLTMIVRAPNLDDWDKMVHMMRYIRSTCMLPLIISARQVGLLTRISHCEFHKTRTQHLQIYRD